MGHRFIRASTQVAGEARGGPSRARSAALRFRTGLRGVLIRKELRLIARDPWLLTQLLGQSAFLVPGGLLLWRRGASGGIPWAWLVGVFFCGSLVSALAWLTVSAEDAPELLASSPVTTATLVRGKIEAALLPVVPLLLLPLYFLLRSHPLFAVSLVACSAGAGISCAWLQIRNPAARRRGDFRTRHKGQGLSGLIEAVVILLWVGVCAGVTALG